ncbi:MAG: 2-C-methyl-D-erythritol 4-phosphate cytidylyltransferase, partial [Eubacterium sp.]|nr:2-C-methyl-D-erythritol 4-phosphate cytidylyltransferase [Eubacterium sp.]
MYNVAVILGAGNGTRMGIDKSKMLLEIDGKTVIEHSVAAFSDMPEIDEIIVVCRECDVELFS